MNEILEFRHILKNLMSKNRYAVEDVASLMDTCPFVIREWLRGSAVPLRRIRDKALRVVEVPSGKDEELDFLYPSMESIVWADECIRLPTPPKPSPSPPPPPPPPLPLLFS